MSAIRAAIQSIKNPCCKNFCDLVADYIYRNGEALLIDNSIYFELAHGGMPDKNLFKLSSDIDVRYFSSSYSIDALVDILKEEGAIINYQSPNSYEIKFEI